MEETRGSVSNYMGPSRSDDIDESTNLPAFARALRRVLAEGERRVIDVPEGVRPASVLVPLFWGDAGEVRVWLLRKVATLRQHAGQVALPGGKRDAGDASLAETALREAHEEIGLAPSAVTMLGALDDVFTFTGYVVTPYVGWLSAPFVPTPDPAEVARIFSAPIATFAIDGRERDLEIRGRNRRFPGYDIDGELLWGATYMILRGMMMRLDNEKGHP